MRVGSRILLVGALFLNFFAVLVGENTEANSTLCRTVFTFGENRKSLDFDLLKNETIDLAKISRSFSILGLNEKDKQIFDLDFLKIANHYLLPSLNDLKKYGGQTLHIAFFAAGSVGKSTLFNAWVFNLDPTLSPDRLIRPHHEMSPVAQEAGYTKRNIYLHSDQLDPSKDSRMIDDDGEPPVSLVISKPGEKLKYDHEAIAEEQGPNFHISHFAMLPNLVLGDTPGFNNGDLGLRSRRAFVRSDVFMIYVNSTNYNDNSMLNEVRHVMDEVGRKKLILVYRLNDGKVDQEVINEGMRHIRKMVYQLYSTPSDSTGPLVRRENQEAAERSVYEKNLSDILGVYFVPYSAALDGREETLDRLEDNRFRFYTDRGDYEQHRTHPRMVPGESFNEISESMKSINDNSYAIKKEVESYAVEKYVEKSRVLLNRAQELQDHIELSLEVYKTLIAKNVVSNFGLFPFDLFKKDLIKIWRNRHHSAIVRGVEKFGRSMMDFPKLAKRLIVREPKVSTEELKKRLDSDAQRAASSILNASRDAFRADEYTIQFRDSDPTRLELEERKTVEPRVDRKTYYLPTSPYFLNRANYNRIFRFIKKDDRSASSPEEAYQWVTSGEPVTIETLNYLKRFYSGGGARIDEDLLRKRVHRVFDTMFYQNRADEVLKNQHLKSIIDPNDLKSYIYSRFEKRLHSEAFKQYEKEIDGQIRAYTSQIESIEKEIKSAKKRKLNQNELKLRLAEIKKLKDQVGTNLVSYIVFNFEQKSDWNSLSEESKDKFKESVRTDVYNELNRVTNKIVRGLKSDTVKTLVPGIGAGVTTASGAAGAANAAIGGLSAKAGVALAAIGGDLFFSFGAGYATMLILDNFILKEDFTELQLVINDWYRAMQVKHVDKVLLDSLVYPLEAKLAQVRNSIKNMESENGLDLKKTQKMLDAIEVLGASAN